MNPQELEQAFNETTDNAVDLLKENVELKNRINKAIGYIWSTKYEWGEFEEDNEDFDIDIYKLLNILKGEDK